MLVLGLDPSLTNFGWCLIDTSKAPAERVLARGRFQTSSKTVFILRYCDLRDQLRKLIQDHKPDKMGCEYPVFGEDYSEGMYGLFLYTNEAVYLEKMDVVYFSPGQGKAHAKTFLKRPSTWKMLKPDMVEAAKMDTGGKGVWNHNEADAYWIAKAASRFWELYSGSLSESDLTDSERKQFLKIHTFKKGKKAGKTIKSGMLYREDERFFLWSKENVDATTEKDRGSRRTRVRSALDTGRSPLQGGEGPTGQGVQDGQPGSQD